MTWKCCEKHKPDRVDNILIRNKHDQSLVPLIMWYCLRDNAFRPQEDVFDWLFILDPELHAAHEWRYVDEQLR